MGGLFRDLQVEETTCMCGGEGIKRKGESGAWKINLIISGLVATQHKSSTWCHFFFTQAIIKINNKARSDVMNSDIYRQLWPGVN